MRTLNIFLLLLVSSSLTLPAAEKSEFSEIDQLFTLKVKPLFSHKCNGCHGDDPEDIKGDYDMLTRDKLLAGGETIGKDVVVVGDSAKSFLVETIKWEDPDFEMPPKENDRLTSEEIAMVEKWINAGAPWPSDEVQTAILRQEKMRPVTADGMIVQSSGGLGDDWTYRRYLPEDLWAFQPVVKPDVPAGGGKNPIDGFHRAKLKAAGFGPAPLADALTLIRRLTFDLTGLPPTPEEVSAFQAAMKKDSEAAYGALVDRLLASTQYGERWAQHWLDVARYADTGGFSNDYERSNAWRYRDYVIRALNEDMPYDQFVIEQLAGDELADDSVWSRTNGDAKKVHDVRLSGDYTSQESEWIVATGFLRMGPWDNAMVKPAEARQLYVDDVVNSVGQTFLSTTMRCFKCHDHKFDPLPTKDYYRVYATFAGTNMAERNVAFTDEENLEGMEKARVFVNKMLDFATAETRKLEKKREAAAKEWFAEHNLEYIPHAKRNGLSDDVKPPRHVGLSPEEQGQLKVRQQDVWIWNRRLERCEPMAQSVYNSTNPKQPNSRRLRIETKGEPRALKSNILTGGALEAKGEEVTPGVISSLGVPSPGGTKDDPWALTKDVNKRRLGLAKWIVDSRNPLTARSIVNRLWQHHFGVPLARNPNNFGVKGAKPSHPKLLDWLSADLVENGWTLKRMHRMMVMSQVYRQAGTHPELADLETQDPDNQLLAYFTPRRLTAEELRDAFLTVTGELNPVAGGLPISPEINMEVALQPRMIQFSLAPAYQPSPTPAERNRRTIYAYRVRGMADPFLELFNQPNPNDSCEMRDAAAVTPQAFTLFNSDFVTDRSIAFAQKLKAEGGDLRKKVELAFERAFCRVPTSDERKRVEDYVSQMISYHQQHAAEPVSYPSKIVRSLVEEFTGEPFEYEEILPTFDDYEPDAKPADVDEETRALADLCLLLFNSNEFVYLY